MGFQNGQSRGIGANRIIWVRNSRLFLAADTRYLVISSEAKKRVSRSQRRVVVVEGEGGKKDAKRGREIGRSSYYVFTQASAGFSKLRPI